MSSLPLGIAVVLGVTAASLVLVPRRLGPVRPFAALLFCLFFLREAFRGGIDVVRRALDPALPLDPVLVTIPLGALSSRQRLVYTVLVSLMPGTLAARLQDDNLTVHVLDRAMGAEAGLARLEARLGAVTAPPPRRGSRGDGRR